MNDVPAIRPADRATLDLLRTMLVTGPVSFAAWREASLSAPGNRNSHRRTFNRALAALRAHGHVQIDEEGFAQLGDGASAARPEAEQAPYIEDAIAGLPDCGKVRARKLIERHAELVSRVKRVGQPGGCWLASSRHDAASALFMCRLKLALSKLPVPPLDAPASAALRNAGMPEDMERFHVS